MRSTRVTTLLNKSLQSLSPYVRSLVQQTLKTLDPEDTFSLVELLLSLNLGFNPIPGGCKFASPLLFPPVQKIWGAAGAPNFQTFNNILLDTFWQNLVTVASLLQILWPFL